MGDVAAHEVDLVALPGVVGKWSAVRAIKRLSERASLRLRVHPHDGLHQWGSVIEVEIDGMRHPYLIVLALSGNGTVHHLYPQERLEDPERVATDRPFREKLRVTPPFGADHIVAVSAARPMSGLNAELMRLDGQTAAETAAELLLAAMAAGTAGWQSGIQGLFTAP